MRSLPRAFYAAVALAALHVGSGYIYDTTYTTGGLIESAYELSEGPMFASGQGPFGGGASGIDLQFRAKNTGGGTPPMATRLVYHAAFYDAGSRPTLGNVRADDNGDLVLDFCCTRAQYDLDLCGKDVNVGDLIYHKDRSLKGNDAVIYTWAGSVPFSPEPVTSGSANVTITREGRQFALLAVCDADGLNLLPQLEIQLQLAFYNPHGYLPGQLYGMLPYYGVLFVLYLLFMLIYSVAALKHREYLLPLQLVLLGVGAWSAIEIATWFFTYYTKNNSGVPTPCNICPVTADYVAALVLSVIKRAVSRGVLLAVACGFGVVVRTLPRRTTLYLAAYMVLYMAAGLVRDIKQNTAYEGGVSDWGIPVMMLEMVFILTFHSQLRKLQAALSATQQKEKLGMYNRLWWALTAAVVVAAGVAVATVLVAAGVVPFPWRSVFFLLEFGDLLYFLLLVAVAWIWAPGPASYRYAWYSQPTGGEDAEVASSAGSDGAAVSGAGARPTGAGGATEADADADADNVEIEMAGIKSPPGTFTIEEGDSDEEAAGKHDFTEESDKVRLAAAASASSPSSSSAPAAAAAGGKGRKGGKGGKGKGQGQVDTRPLPGPTTNGAGGGSSSTAASSDSGAPAKSGESV